MRRREFITLLGGAVAAPITAYAQRTAMPMVGFIHILSLESVPHYVSGFQQGLKEAGFVEGHNVAVEYRWAQGQYDRLPQLAADLVRRQVAVIVASGGEPSPQVAKAATQTIPVVFTANGDPVSEGLVASLNQPGGNLTGITIFGPATVTKRLQLLQELMPEAATFAYLMNPNNPNAVIEMRTAETAVRSLGREMFVVTAASEQDLDSAFAMMNQKRADALLVASDTFFLGRRKELVAMVAGRRLPAAFYLREFAEAGGLMTYGNSLIEVYRQVGLYVARILKGEKPADLPVQQSTKFELVINLKTAKVLGLTIPPSLLARADEVIE